MVPSTAHFVWLGRAVPWVHLCAIASAARSGGFERVFFHHADELSGLPTFEAIRRLPGVETRKLEALSLLESAAGEALVDCYRALATPAAKSNLLRVALLAEQGGVYLDTDTVTLRNFGPLLAPGGFFCGEERLVFPGRSGTGVVSRLRPGALVRTLVRDVLRRIPDGQRWFRAIERYYPTAVNNAVLGAEAGHPLLQDLLSRMAALPPERRRLRYSLGTHLLQAAVASFTGPDLRILPPRAFYPLGPEISEHWFRLRPSVSLSDALDPEQTYVVHWYASVRTDDHVRRLNAEFVREHAGRQLFSALVLPIVTDLEMTRRP